MSKQGMKLAIKVGLGRKQFLNKESAENYFEKQKSAVFKFIEDLKFEYPKNKLDYSPESLKDIESIYFDYLENSKFSEEGITKSGFEVVLAIYYGNVYVQNDKANWIVKEDDFVKGNRYFLAIRSINGSTTIDCTKWGNHERRPNNKRRQLIYREYKKYSDFCT